MVRGLGRAALTCSSTCNRRTPFGPPQNPHHSTWCGAYAELHLHAAPLPAPRHTSLRALGPKTIPRASPLKAASLLERVPRSATALDRSREAASTRSNGLREASRCSNGSREARWALMPGANWAQGAQGSSPFSLIGHPVMAFRLWPVSDDHLQMVIMYWTSL